jgi:hypothetical protein
MPDGPKKKQEYAPGAGLLGILVIATIIAALQLLR